MKNNTITHGKFLNLINLQKNSTISIDFKLKLQVEDGNNISSDEDDSNYCIYKEEKGYLDIFVITMQSKIEEILIAKNFSVTGPFLSYNDMIFLQKRAADYILETKLELNVDEPNNDRIPDNGNFSTSSFRVVKNGKITVDGFVKYTIM